MAVLTVIRNYCFLIKRLVVVLWTLAPGLVFAQGEEIFRWLDEKGVVHYSDLPAAGARKVPLTKSYAYYKVSKVYDGDTIKLADGRKVRLLNINAPEVETTRKRGEPGADAATQALQRWLSGRKVRLEYDVEGRDKYHRTLAYLFTEDRKFINAELVREGLAVATIHPPNLKYAHRILAAQQQAEKEGKGLWGFSAYAPKPIVSVRQRRLHGWQRLQGTVRDIDQGKKYVMLMMAPDIRITIPRANLELFPEPSGYLGHKVEVRGWPSRRKSSFSILVRHPSDLVSLD